MDAYSISEAGPVRPPVTGPVAVARFVATTRAEGPGTRTAVWVQGCAIRCPGCFNPQLWGFRGGDLLAPADLLARVLAADSEGLTLLGGEPFDQAAALAEVAAGVRDAGRSVMTFTGYTTAGLRRAVDGGRTDVAALLAATDLLVAGPFRADLVDTGRPWVGSTNQEFVLLSDRFPGLLDELRRTPDRVEVLVDPAGRVSVNGWAELDALDDLLATAQLRRAGPAAGVVPGGR
ncbi:4Fe-4S single cluster domain-containing protein [Micromonospora coxensis]|uniref:Anaerobic ribonucleoside-triphosphate reductase activating protein n=1 Tax=Micromonospora coxensis TaxID=356852 RepID=A0A1C5JC94_9ACTN|nr:4Fe-4S single cluster domain-containing protein [Micromonospora coxensis]SCG68158.1 anaerobic ribonucleoside-triphosphate reductase activating protein [Micromonospora coxensis]